MCVWRKGSWWKCSQMIPQRSWTNLTCSVWLKVFVDDFKLFGPFLWPSLSSSPFVRSTCTFILRCSDPYFLPVHPYLLYHLCVCLLEVVLVVSCVSTWRTMPSVCLYSDREIALSLLTLSLHHRAIALCVWEEETVSQSFWVTVTPLCAFQGSLVSIVANLCMCTLRTRKLMNSFLEHIIIFKPVGHSAGCLKV